MAWVKQWDHCVFGKKKGKKRQRDDDENFNAEDEYHRPREKVESFHIYGADRLY
jgi:chromosome transmission fidelity protein 18